MYDVATLGELLIDFAMIDTNKNGYPILDANAGGATCNFLVAVSACEKSTVFMSKVGKDTFGDLLINTMKSVGVDTKGIVQDDKVFTTLAFVTIDETGNRSFAFARKPGADTCLSFEEIDLSIIDSSKVFHFGTLSLTDEPVYTATRKIIEYAKNQGKLITFDPNLRLPLWKSAEQAKTQILWGLSQSDIVKISDEEVEFLWDCTPEEGAERLLSEFGVSLAIVTLGPKGSLFMNKNGSISVAGPNVTAVDTTGAGDTFGGTSVACVLSLEKHPSDLTTDEMQAVAQYATAAAGISVQSIGGVPSIPSKQQVIEQLLKDGHTKAAAIHDGAFKK